MRAKLRNAAFTAGPMWLSRGRVSRSKAVMNIAVNRHELAMPQLPDALDGLRITHLSDLHIGKLVTPDRLPEIVDTCNALEGDMIALTGDFVDLSLGVLDDVIAAIKQLRAPLGVHLVLGNHDYLDDGEEVIRRFRKADLSLLMNQRTIIEHAGCAIALSGIDWAKSRTGLARLVRSTVGPGKRRDDVDLSLLLAHHPHAFDAAHKRRVDLTLSGHTHGGQVAFRRRNGNGVLSLANLAFRYPRGLYQRGTGYLYVNAGLGSWFPMRMNCPAEIAQLTLKSEPVANLETSHP